MRILVRAAGEPLPGLLAVARAAFEPGERGQATPEPGDRSPGFVPVSLDQVQEEAAAAATPAPAPRD